MSKEIKPLYRIPDDELSMILIALDNAYHNYPCEPEKYKHLKEKLQKIRTPYKKDGGELFI